MNDCLFCSLYNKTNIIYEDDYVFACYDINPKSKIHILVISKLHFDNILSIDLDMNRIKNSICAISKQLFLDKFFVIINYNKPYQHINHFHLHIRKD